MPTSSQFLNLMQTIGILYLFWRIILLEKKVGG